MVPLRQPSRRSRAVLILTIALGLAVLFWPSRWLGGENFVFYFPGAHQVVPLEVIGHVKYLPLLRVLNLVGKVSSLQERRNSLRLWFGPTQVEVRSNDRKVGLNKVWVTLADPARISNGQWMVPVDFLTAVLPRLMNEPVEYQMGTNRVFVGDVKPASFTVRLEPLPNGARLTLQFTDKITARTAAQDGKWVMFLGDRAIEPLDQVFRFQDRYVRELRFDDQDGQPKLILTPTGDGLNFYPSQAEEGKVLLADVRKPPSGVAPGGETEAAAPPTTARGLAPSAPPPGAEELPETPPGPPLPAVVLDAGHGGPDTGARSRDGILEKDLVAQLVARVRLALLATKAYRVVLTRVGDNNPTFDQRDAAVNLARPVAFLSFHAGNLGRHTPRVAVYTYPALVAAGAKRAGDLSFIPWTRGQQPHLEESQRLARALQEQLEKIPWLSLDMPSEAPVRALRSVDAPAVAVELGSLSSEVDSGALTTPYFQQQLATAIVQALRTHEGRQP